MRGIFSIGRTIRRSMRRARHHARHNHGSPLLGLAATAAVGYALYKANQNQNSNDATQWTGDFSEPTYIDLTPKDTNDGDGNAFDD